VRFYRRRTKLDSRPVTASFDPRHAIGPVRVRVMDALGRFGTGVRTGSKGEPKSEAGKR